MNLPILDKWIRGNFLFLCIILACLFALYKKATIFQLEKTTSTTTPLVDNPLAKDQAFQRYWNTGLSEINTYELTKMVDTSHLTGHAELIFTSENFNTKLYTESTVPNDPEATRVLKVNLTQKIASGIYEYSSMNSTFTPTNYVVFPHALKVLYSKQSTKGLEDSQLQWQGQTFRYQSKSNDKHGIQGDTSVHTAWLEDEIWNRIRLNPQTLPDGEIEMIPSIDYLSNTHQKIEAKACKVSLEEIKDSVSNQITKRFLIEYPAYHRRLSILFEAKFPYKILNWESSCEQNRQIISIKARLLETKHTALNIIRY